MTRKFKCPYCGRESELERIGELWIASCSYYTCNNPNRIAGIDLDEVIDAFEIHTPEYDAAEGLHNDR